MLYHVNLIVVIYFHKSIHLALDIDMSGTGGTKFSIELYPQLKLREFIFFTERSKCQRNSPFQNLPLPF